VISYKNLKDGRTFKGILLQVDPSFKVID